MDTPAYDVIVVGAGPAGLTAATEAARAGLKTLCLDKLAPGGEIINLGRLHDFEEMFSGTDFAARLTDDAAVAGVEIGFGEVSALHGTGPFEIETTDGERHGARAIVIATGLDKGRLGIPGEDEYEGRGLSHCANCDGPLYAGQPVVVAGGEGWGPYEALALVGIAGKIMLVGKTDKELGDDIEVIDGRVVGVEGSSGVDAVIVESGGARNTIPANAVFVNVGRHPAAKFLPDSLARDASGHIVIDDQGQTSTPLVYAVGDVRAGAREYVADAIADGQKVAKALAASIKK